MTAAATNKLIKHFFFAVESETFALAFALALASVALAEKTSHFEPAPYILFFIISFHPCPLSISSLSCLLLQPCIRYWSCYLLMDWNWAVYIFLEALGRKWKSLWTLSESHGSQKVHESCSLTHEVCQGKRQSHSKSQTRCKDQAQSKGSCCEARASFS